MSRRSSGSTSVGLSIVTVALALGVVQGSCAQGTVVDSPGSGAASGSGAAAGGQGGAGLVTVSLDAQPPQSQSTVDGGGTPQKVACSGGSDCVCPPFNVAVIGKPGTWGAVRNADSDTALQDWLNTSSAGTAKADNFKNRVKLTPDFLATYNVIILASLSDDSNAGPFWKFDNSEVAAFQAWVESGGGVISLTSYSGDGTEVDPTNQLLAFSGISYNKDGLYATCVDWRVCSCAHANTLSTWIKTDPVIANLSSNVTWVGLDNGRSINAPADAHVAATVDGPKNALVGKLVGKGHVLAYADEWITYTSQWSGTGNPSSSDLTCAGFLPQNVFQVPQFWYNMIRWSQPSATCFKIVDQPQPVVVW